jgi:hypothetical protein
VLSRRPNMMQKPMTGKIDHVPSDLISYSLLIIRLDSREHAVLRPLILRFMPREWPTSVAARQLSIALMARRAEVADLQGIQRTGRGTNLARRFGDSAT